MKGWKSFPNDETIARGKGARGAIRNHKESEEIMQWGYGLTSSPVRN